MKKEIRKDVREYILSQVNETIARLGIDKDVVETNVYESTYMDKLYYNFESAPISQMPVMFKKLIVTGHMVSVVVKEGDRFFECQKAGNDIIAVNIEYSYNHFDGGSNGCNIGRMVFAVCQELPKSFKSECLGDIADLYVRKIESLTI